MDTTQPPERGKIRKDTTIPVSKVAHEKIKRIAGDDTTLGHLMEVIAANYEKIHAASEVTGMKPVDLLKVSIESYCDRVCKTDSTKAIQVGSANPRIETALRRCVEDDCPVTATQLQKYSGCNYVAITRFLKLPSTDILIKELKAQKAKEAQVQGVTR